MVDKVHKSKKSKKQAQAVVPTLSSFLLGQTEQTDAALDNIFSTSKGPSIAFTAPTKDKIKKIKLVEAPVASTSELAAAVEDEDEEMATVQEDAEDVPNDADLSEADSDESLDLPSDSDDDAGVEEAYAAAKAASRLKSIAQGGKQPAPGEDEDSYAEAESGSESELDIDNLIHETLLPKAKKIKTSVIAPVKVPTLAKPVRKVKLISNNTPEERDARTIFIGNVPVECSTSRPMKKALIRHVLTHPTLLALLPDDFPALKADSIRFRSLAFASTVFGRKATVEGAPEDAPPIEPGGRGRKRARDWRDSENVDTRGVRGGFRETEEERKAATQPAGGASDKKGALTDGQKRRVAFIRGELNEGKKACNAYLVVDNLPDGAAHTLAEVIKLLVDCTDGSLFESFTLRADHVRPRSSAATLAAAQTLAKPSTNLIAPQLGGIAYTVPPLEARRTLFMGGLDFAESEESIRVATEAVLVREKGAAGGDRGYVERVRIIRDASTGLGKGFGYVLLRDAECVDELLALPAGSNLKVSKRRVRLERCKTGVAAARAKAAAATAREAKALPAAARESVFSGGVPRDPASFMTQKLENRPRMSNSATESAHQAKLAEALSKLPPAERKAVKAVDPDRLERRSAKKTNKRLGERYERKQAAAEKSGGGILGRPTLAEERNRKEKKRVAAGNKTGKRAKPIKP